MVPRPRTGPAERREADGINGGAGPRAGFEKSSRLIDIRRGFAMTKTWRDILVLTVILFITRGAVKLAAQNSPAQGIGVGNNFVETLRLAETKTAAKQWADAAPLWEKVTQANPLEVRYWERLA